MSLTFVGILAAISLAAYAAGATLIARRAESRHLSKIATIFSVVAVGTILTPTYLDSHFWWSREITVMGREVAAYAIAACLLVVPAVGVTTKLARHYASSDSPPVKSWALTWVAAVTILLLSSFLALAAAMMISGDSP